MSRRRLRPDELELWNLVASSTERLPGRPMREVPKPAPKPAPPRQKPDPLPAFSLGDRATPVAETHDFYGTTADRLKSAPLNMDAKAYKTMRRGKLLPEARLDLHGMTLDQAHPELIRFILMSQTRALRLVLVITGKGLREDPHDPMPRRRGVLKTQVPQWLRLPPVAQAVLQVSEAHNKHGGGGAYYVYLRKRR
ncbi:Smr/MutS family protein [Salipiger sp. 1_MG-2023]|uniref:Smr/MutS family protein n=1 Tax=Salipiger sp. 1_MG-2023 TaxID=3062665 RepID=UPI0026E3E6E2|nr:Smr/MutS family protein [Salipiger sp. 1_MG-2023]MDO6586429.1 Smr/MutS family protein [Salipiger sp. 1_MG-2023]